MELCPTRHSRAWKPRYNHLGIKTVSSRLLQRMTRVEADRHGLKLKKMKTFGFFEFQCYTTQITEKNKNKTKTKMVSTPRINLFFYLLHNSTGAFCVLIQAPNIDISRDLTF